MDAGQSGSRGQNRARAERACQACRSSKVRCRKPDDDQPCLRCSEVGRHCVPREESNKRQKVLDSRSIDGIEARLDALAEVLQYRDANTSSAQATTVERTTTLEPQPVPTSLGTTRTRNSAVLLSNEYSTAHLEQLIRDTIDDETISLIFSHFIENMLQHFPFMAFRPHATAEAVLRTTPTLLLAILDAAGDGFYDTNIARHVRKLLVRVYSTCLLDTNLYSVSLLQALIVSVVWHRDLDAPQAGEQMDVFQISHTAANMAMVMGMGKGNQYTSLEVRRLWLACYYICSSASMALHTPNIMRWTRHMDECLDVLSVSDQVLCAHVRLQHILEEFEAQLSSTSSSTAVNITHRVAKRQLSEWAPVVRASNDSLKMSQQFVTLYIHELKMTTIPGLTSPSDDGRTSVIISGSDFSECAKAAHKLLDTFLALDMSLIRALSTSCSVQITHTAIVLVKLHFASRNLRNHGGSDLKADNYLGRLVKKFSGWGTLWPTQKLSHTLRRLHRMLRQCGNRGFASELSWLDVWTLAGSLSGDFAGRAGATMNHCGSAGERVPASQDVQSAERATLSTFDEELLAWSVSGTGQSNITQDTAQNALPSASLDATQLIDCFGTDLNTSTFDFDGNLQSMIQFPD